SDLQIAYRNNLCSIKLKRVAASPSVASLVVRLHIKASSAVASRTTSCRRSHVSSRLCGPPSGALVHRDGGCFSRGALKGFSEVHQQSFQPCHRRLVPFDLPLPATRLGISRQGQFDLAPAAEPGSIDGGGHNLGTGQIQIALTGPFRRQAQAVS